MNTTSSKRTTCWFEVKSDRHSLAELRKLLGGKGSRISWDKGSAIPGTSRTRTSSVWRSKAVSAKTMSLKPSKLGLVHTLLDHIDETHPQLLRNAQRLQLPVTAVVGVFSTSYNTTVAIDADVSRRLGKKKIDLIVCVYPTGQ